MSPQLFPASGPGHSGTGNAHVSGSRSKSACQSVSSSPGGTNPASFSARIARSAWDGGNRNNSHQRSACRFSCSLPAMSTLHSDGVHPFVRRPVPFASTSARMGAFLLAMAAAQTPSFTPRSAFAYRGRRSGCSGSGLSQKENPSHRSRGKKAPALLPHQREDTGVPVQYG